MSALDDLVAVMARLRGPGGCPWDAEQTHASLVPYLLEEAHELIEAIEAGDDAHVREELGDVLLQVVFHAEIARGEGRFDIEDVARELAEKLRRRHPHVFGDVEAATTDAVVANWDALKRAEKPSRESAFDGIPPTLPALARAEKLLGRAERAGLVAHSSERAGRGEPEPARAGRQEAEPARAGRGEAEPARAERSSAETELGARLLELVRDARASGIDPEGALRAELRALEANLRAQERTARIPPAER